MSNNLVGLTVSNTFGRLVQVIDDKFYDGFGNLLNIGPGTTVSITPTGLSSSSNNFNIDGGTPSSPMSGVFKIDFGGIQ